MRRKSGSSGFTLVETLVVLTLIIILISLLMVGIQSVRESSRRLACENNLHQLGIALSNFVSSNGTFPSLAANRKSKGVDSFFQTCFVTILPELDIHETHVGPRLPGPEEPDLPPVIFRCPSSNEYLAYRYSFGSGLENRKNLNGMLRLFRGISPSEITDGLSNTVVMSERISGKINRKPIGVVALPLFLTQEAFVDGCQNKLHPVDPTDFFPDPGVRWRGYQPVDIGYNHYSSPNSFGWDCLGHTEFQLLAARSYHSGGVFALNADASVRWITSGIALTTWQALGTVAGQEEITQD